MQYIEYEYAKENNIIGLTIYTWLQTVTHLDIRTKGRVISDWRRGSLLLQIGEKTPGFVNQEVLEGWRKAQINTDYHRKAYQSAYLKGYFKL